MKKKLLIIFFIFTNAQAGKPRPLTISAEKIATFKVVQKIFEKAHETALELKDICKLSIGEKPSFDHTQSQTKQGICLIEGTYPRFLETPWGLIPLFVHATFYNPDDYQPGDSSDDFFDASKYRKFNTAKKYIIAQPSTLFFKKIAATFEKELSLEKHEQHYAELVIKIWQDTLVLDEFIDLNSNPGRIYTVDSVDDVTCPSYIECPREQYRSPEDLQAELQALQELEKSGYTSPSLLKKNWTTVKTSRPASPNTASSSRPDSPEQDLLDSPCTPTASSKCSLM